MAIYLVQHGKSLSKEKDPQKGLSEEGKAQTKLIADVAKGYQVRVSAIVHSGKTRALQTADIFDKILGPPNSVKQISGMNPMDDVTAFADLLDPKFQTMYVGHLPFMARLTSYLIAGDIEIPVFAFQNSGIVCLDKTEDQQHWIIKWTLMPSVG